MNEHVPPPPGPEIVHKVLVRSALGEQEPFTVSRRRRVLALLAAQVRLIHGAMWPAAALAMAGATVLTLRDAETAPLVLSLVVPLIAGAGAVGLHGPANDPAFELVAAAPTSPRVVLLARTTVVLGFDLLLGLAASAAVAGAGLLPLVLAWLGPMVMLAALALVVSVWWNPEGAITVALAVWSAHSLSLFGSPGLTVLAPLRELWTTNALTVGLAVVLGAIAVAGAGRGEPIRRDGATQWA